MHARSVPGLCVDDRALFVRLAVADVGLAASVERRRLEHTQAQALDGGPEEHAAVGGDGGAGRRDPRHVVERLEVHVRPALATGRDRVSERRDFVEAAADDQERIRGPEALADARGRTVAGHAQV